MFLCKRPFKLVIFLVSAMCLTLANLPIPALHSSKEFLVFCFMLSEIKHLSRIKKMLKGTIIWRLMTLMFVAMLVLFVFSPHYLSAHGFIVLLKSEVLIKYFVIAYAFISLTKEVDLHVIYRGSIVGLSILTFFAIVNLIEGQSSFVSEMMQGSDFFTGMDEAGEDFGERYSDDKRFRVQGMFLLAFDYGYVCATLFIFYWFGILRKYIPRPLGIYALICCSFGVLTCNCRTVIFCLLIAFFVFYYSVYGKRIVKYMIILFVGFVFLYASIPAVSKAVDEKVISIFVENDNVGGSSFAMRAVQYAAVLTHVQGHELFGRGKDYFNIDLGWQDGRQFLEDPDLEGIEGVLLNLILERGLVGVLFWLLFYVSLFFYFKKNKIYDDKVASLGMAYISYYFIYANMTGEMGCVFPTMLLLGISVKEMFFAKQKATAINELSEK